LTNVNVSFVVRAAILAQARLVLDPNDSFITFAAVIARARLFFDFDDPGVAITTIGPIARFILHKNGSLVVGTRAITIASKVFDRCFCIIIVTTVLAGCFTNFDGAIIIAA
jgi:hypothetical protein